MAKFAVPAAKKQYSIETENYLGVDRTTPPGNVSMSRSPECPNMIRSTPGIVRKRHGIKTMNNYRLASRSSYTVTHVASVGDTFTFLGITFTAVASGATGNQFNVAATTILQAGAIKNAMAATTSISSIYEVTLYSTNSNAIIVKEVIPGGGNNPGTMTTTGSLTVTVYSFSLSATQKINGVHFLKTTTGTKKLVHSGEDIYVDGSLLVYNMAPDDFSVSAQLDEKLWIVNGWHFSYFDGTRYALASELAYIPTTIIARTPTGGGTLYEETNLLDGTQKVLFSGTASAVDYYLPYQGVEDYIKVEVLSGVDAWVVLTETTEYSLNKTIGVVTFVTAPGVSPISGEDNIRITFTKTIQSNVDKIDKCTICTLYGMNGARDRLFVSGNPNYPNYDFYSAVNDPTYFGDLSYCVVGQDSSAIVGYSIVNDYLVTHKDNAEGDNNASLRSGSLVGGKAVFATVGSYQTAGALAKHSFAVLENEPLYVTTSRKIAAVTPSDIFGERFSQERSYRLATDLEKDVNLADSYACVHNNMYFLASGSTIYVLDGMQYSIEKNRPYSSRQYEAYYFPNISARVIWSENGELWFGTADGLLKKFDITEYSDDGVAITSYWDTPELDGNSFSEKKTFIYIAARIAAYVRTSVRFRARVKGIWETIMDYNNEANYLDFSDMDFSEFTFSTDATPHTIGKKIKIKNVDKIQFRLENSVLNEPFSIYKAKFKYTEGNEYKK